jgi:hypothetical protein
MFSPEEYTHTTPGKGLVQIGCFITAALGLCGVVSLFYPDKASAPREFEGGLEKELGGPGAVRVGHCKTSLPPLPYISLSYLRHEHRAMSRRVESYLLYIKQKEYKKRFMNPDHQIIA